MQHHQEISPLHTFLARSRLYDIKGVNGVQDMSWQKNARSETFSENFSSEVVEEVSDILLFSCEYRLFIIVGVYKCNSFLFAYER